MSTSTSAPHDSDDRTEERPDRLGRGADTLAHLADLAYFEVDGHRNLTRVSPALERITGFRAEDVIGQSCLTLIRCEECRRGCGVFRFGEVLDAPITLSRADGSPIQVTKSGRTFRDEAGEITGAVEVVVPVDGGHTAARNAAATVDSVMGSLGRHYLTLDSGFRVASHSKALTELTGLDESQLHGVSVEGILGSELFAAESPFRAQVEAGETREGVRANLMGARGRSVPVSLSIGSFESAGPCAGLSGQYLVMIRPDRAPETLPSYRGMISRSPAMQRIYRVIELLRENDSTVLITGESGTGKELVARALHETSHRSDGPLVTINCAAIPSELLESELFGHVRGAFTGAVRDRVGRFELADGGTLFLDEIGDLALGLQAKLLRVLQHQTFERVGDSRTRRVDVRVIAATHADLVSAVASRAFRQDLYYRLRVVPIEIPPLRERREDVDVLVRHFMARMGKKSGRSLELSPTAVRALMNYSWPGNVRQLENALAYATTVCEGQTIHVHDLPEEVKRGTAGITTASVGADRAGAPGGAGALTEEAGQLPGGVHRMDLSPAEALEAEDILDALRRSRFRRAEAAEVLGVSRTTLWRKMKQYGLD